MPSPQPDAATGPRKNMRKGTRSCYECRKRKVRCVYAKAATICENCAARGKTCIEQRRELLQAAALDTRESLRDRVARLEAIIKEQASSSDGGSANLEQGPKILGIDGRDVQSDGLEIRSRSSSSVVSNPTPVSISSSHDLPLPVDKESSQHIDPIVTLFNNAIWKRHSSDLSQEHLSKRNEVRNPAAAAKRIRTCEALLSDLLAPNLLLLVMSATCSWWHTWRPLGPWLPASIGDKKSSTLPDFVLWALESPDPSIIGLAMLCVAVCLQQLDARVHEYIIRQLPRSPGALFQENFEKVKRLVMNDGDYASTEEGMEVLMLAGKIYMNLGLHRETWLLTHQAVAYSQLLGFHRPERLSVRESEQERHRHNQSWLSLCTADVYSSLLLGLPYAGDGRTIPITHSQQSQTSLLQHNLIHISAEVIDRNQRGLSLSVSRTEDIQKQIETATVDLDEAFWNAPASLASNKITREEYLERLSTHCWLYQITVFLYMPLMIQSVQDVRLEKHRIACLDASRNLLKTYLVMRSDSFSAFGMIKLIDYQAFVCSALLILGLLGYGGSVRGAANQDKDRDLIGLAIATLRQASGTVNNPVASEAVQGLETLMLLDSGMCAHHTDSSCVNPYAKILVPNVGTIIISPGEFFTNPRPESTASTNTLPKSLEFTFSNDMFQEFSGTANRPSQAVNISTGVNDEQASGLEISDPVYQEMASIDFDWASTLAPNFEGDWAWLNDLSY